MAKQLKKIPKEVQKALEGDGARIPHLAELIGHIMHTFGGPKKFALVLCEEFENAPKGSIIRQRLLDGMLKMLTTANQSMPVLEETDLVTAEDLKRELSVLIASVGDGEEETPS